MMYYILYSLYGLNIKDQSGYILNNTLLKVLFVISRFQYAI